MPSLVAGRPRAGASCGPGLTAGLLHGDIGRGGRVRQAWGILPFSIFGARVVVQPDRRFRISAVTEAFTLVVLADRCANRQRDGVVSASPVRSRCGRSAIANRSDLIRLG